MISTAPIVTSAGKSLQIKALGGEVITFTRFKIGDGVLPFGADISLFTDLMSTKLEFSIMDIDKSEENFARITGRFDNTEIEEDFKWTELGLFAEGSTEERFTGDGESNTFTIISKPPLVHTATVDGQPVGISAYNAETGVVTLMETPAELASVVITRPDGNEVLYAYSYDGDAPGTLKASSTDVIAEQTVSIVLAIGDAVQVTAMISASTLYVTQTEFERHLNDHNNPHNITKATIGLENVPNAAPAQQVVEFTAPAPTARLQNIVNGERNSIIYAKIVVAIRSLIDHLANMSNPHGVNCEQIGAALASHTHSTQAITEGILPVSRGGTGSGSVDNSPVQNSVKMVTSGGVYSALQTKAAVTHTHNAIDITGLANGASLTFTYDASTKTLSIN